MTGVHEEGVMSTADRLIYMANQIARNLEIAGGERAADMVADHIRSFWDPAMRRNIIRLAGERPDALTPIAASAIRHIAS